MGAYNGEDYLEETMESILAQTYQNWECIVINDCSTDQTAEILESYAKRDPRVKVYHNETNLRLPATLNRALDLAEGEYVARMDADDICRKDRLEKQVAFMDAHPELALCSCRLMNMPPDQIIPTNLHRRTGADIVKAMFLFFQPINHPGVMARKADMAALRYDPHYSCTEDLDLWTRMIYSGRNITVMDDYFHLYRQHSNQVTVTYSEKQREQYREIIRAFYRKMMFELNEEELEFLEKGIYFREYMDIERYLAFIKKVFQTNKEKKCFSEEAVQYAAFEVLMAYRGDYGLEKKQFLKALSAFSPTFVGREFVRRRKAYQKSLQDAKIAADMFGFVLQEPADRIPVYIRKKSE